MTQISSSRDPNKILPDGGRLQLESGNALPKEDLIADLATDPKFKTTIVGSSGDQVEVNSHGHLSVYSPSEVLAANSTSTPLLADGVFTGTSRDILEFAIIQLSVFSNVASAADGLSVQFSSDGTNWDITDDFTVPANSGKTYSFQPVAQYMRVVYTNGGTGQATFRLQTIGSHSNTKASSHRISDPIIDDDDATLTTTVIKAKFNGDGYGNLAATASGNLKVTDAESGLAIAKGDVTNTTFVHKFGAAPDFDITDGFVTVWDGAEDGAAWELMQYNYSTSADIDTISSSDAGDTQDIQIQGLDGNYNLVNQTATLNGQNKVTLDTPLLRVFRAFNDNATNLTGHVIIYVDGAISGGVPTTNADIRCIIQPENNQTEMAIYTIPNGKTGYMRSWYASTAGAKRDSAHTIKLLSREQGKVFRLKHKANIDVNGTSYIQHEYVEPEVFTAKTDIEIQMDTDTDIAGVAGGFDIVLVDSGTAETASSSSSSSSGP